MAPGLVFLRSQIVLLQRAVRNYKPTVAAQGILKPHARHGGYVSTDRRARPLTYRRELSPFNFYYFAITNRRLVITSYGRRG